MIKKVTYSGLIFIFLFLIDSTVNSKNKYTFVPQEQIMVLKADVVNFLKTLSGRIDDVKFTEILEAMESESDTSQEAIILSLKTKMYQQGLSLSDYFRDIGFNDDDIGNKLIEVTDHAIENSIITLRMRLEQSGIIYPSVYKTGSMRISVELPGEIRDEIKTVVQTTGKITFNICKDNNFSKKLFQDIDNALFVSEPGLEAQQFSKYFDAKFSESLIALIAYEKDILKIETILKSEKVKSVIPGDITFCWARNEITGMDNTKYKELYVVKKETEISEKAIINASFEIDKNSEMPYVSIEMDSSGAEEWERITEANINKKCAIVFDGIVYSSPVIRDKITGGKTIIQGMATVKEAKILSILLKSGALEIPLKIIE